MRGGGRPHHREKRTIQLIKNNQLSQCNCSTIIQCCVNSQASGLMVDDGNIEWLALREGQDHRHDDDGEDDNKLPL